MSHKELAAKYPRQFLEVQQQIAQKDQRIFDLENELADIKSQPRPRTSRLDEDSDGQQHDEVLRASVEPKVEFIEDVDEKPKVELVEDVKEEPEPEPGNNWALVAEQEKQLREKDKHLDQLKGHVGEQRLIETDLRRELGEKGELISQLHDTVKREGESNGHLQKKMKEESARAEELSSALQIQVKSNEDTRVKLIEQKAYVSELSALLENSKGNFKKLKARSDEKTAHITRLDSILQETRESHESLKTQSDERVARMADLEGSLETERQGHESLKRKIASLEVEVNRRAERVTELETLLAATQSKYDDASARVRDLTSMVQEADDESNRSKQPDPGEENALEALMAELGEARTKIAQLESTISVLQTRSEEAEGTVVQLEQKLESPSTEKRTPTENTLRDLTAQIDQLREVKQALVQDLLGARNHRLEDSDKETTQLQKSTPNGEENVEASGTGENPSPDCYFPVNVPMFRPQTESMLGGKGDGLNKRTFDAAGLVDGDAFTPKKTRGSVLAEESMVCEAQIKKREWKES